MQLQSLSLKMIKFFFFLFFLKKILNGLKLKILFFYPPFFPDLRFVCIVGLSELVDLFNRSINIRFNIVINVIIRSSFSLLSYSCK